MHKALDFILADPWCIEPAALEQILLIAQRLNDQPEAIEARLGKPLDNTRTVTIRDGVAVVPISGPMFRYANLFTRISGATSTEIIAQDIQSALDNQAVKRLVLNIDSPGGQASGISELAALVSAASKPVTAYVDGACASAAYWITSAASRIQISSTSLLGSIGTVATYRPEKDGPIKVISTQSPLKQATPDTEAGLEEVQRVVDDLTSVFISDVARYRRTTAEKVVADFGAGGLLVGAKAVAAGMADSLGSLESIIAGDPGQHSKEAFSMSEKDEGKGNGPDVTAPWLKANHQTVYTEICGMAVEAAAAGLRAEGAESERTRIQSVRAQALAGHEKLVEKLAFDGHTTGEQAAIQILSAEKDLRTKASDDLHSETLPPVPSGATETGATDGTSNLTTEERCKSEWSKDPDLRAEFSSFEAYLAFSKASESNKIRTFGSKAA